MAEANALADPILAAVQGRPPDFADDFSQADASWTYQHYDPESDSWDCENTNTDDVRMEIWEGRMQIRGKRDCALTFVYQPKLKYASFLLQADVGFPDQGAQLSLFLNRMKDGTEEQELMAEFQFGAGGNWSLATLKAPGSTWLAEDSGLISLDISEPVRLTHINRDNASILLLNAVPVSLYRGEADAGALFREDFMVVAGDGGLAHVAVELDNIKVWDLDRIAELRPPVTNPQNGHLYAYVEESSTWDQAMEYCQSRGRYLATIEDASENTFIYQLTGGVTWLGATDEAREGFWVWANGQPMEYSNFAEGQPSMHGSRGAGYLTFAGDAEAGDMLETWKDAPAEVELPFVCEWEADGQQ
jgi:hypothetical protein